MTCCLSSQRSQHALRVCSLWKCGRHTLAWPGCSLCWVSCSFPSNQSKAGDNGGQQIPSTRKGPSHAHSLHTCKKKEKTGRSKRTLRQTGQASEGFGLPLERNGLLLRLAKLAITLTSIVSKLLPSPFLPTPWEGGEWLLQ